MTDLNKPTNDSLLHDEPADGTRDALGGSGTETSQTTTAIDGLMSSGDEIGDPTPRIVTKPARVGEPRDVEEVRDAEEGRDAGDDAAAAETPTKKKKVVKKKKAVTKKVAKRATPVESGGEVASSNDGDAIQADADRAGSREIDGPPVHNRLVINYVPGEECRVAVVFDDRLEELHAEKAGSNTIVGNIYVGKVTNVEASMQAAFVDFGHGANGFLHVSDLHPQYFPGADDEEMERIGKKTPRRDRPPIQRCLKRGQEIFVQVIKEGISTKGPTLTSYLSIPGRYVVMLPFMDKVGVSRKVEDDEERKALRQVLDQIDLPKGFGFIGRTAGIGKTKTEIKRDLAYLQRLWKDIERRHKASKGPRLLYAESDLLMRVLRDVWTNEIEEIVIDNESAVKRADRFLKIMAPRTETRLAYYNEPRPIFHAFGLEKQIEQVFARQVPLPSGGYLVFDEAEALIAIDVNSGKSRSAGDAESNAFNTNKEAVEEICRQLKLRDVGGLVLMDLIDMMHRSNRREIEKLMAERLKRDRAATRFLPISDFGIMEMTRQRFRGSLKSMHFTTCPTCDGRAHVRKPTSLANGLLRTIANLFAYEKIASVRAQVSARVATELLTHKRHQIARLEHASGKKFDIIVSEEMGVDHVALVAYDGKGGTVELDRLPIPNPPRRLSAWEGGLKLGEDWSVDAADEREAARREAMTIIAAEAALPEEPADDPLLSDDLLSDELVDEALGEDAKNASLGRENRTGRGRGGRGGGKAAEKSGEAESDGEGGRKRRRRRRRGGRKEGDEGQRDGRDARDESRDDDAEREDGPRKHGPSGEGERGEAEGEGGRKRRRRRRRRGGRREDGQSGGDEADAARESSGGGSSGGSPGGAGQAGESPVRKRVVVKKVVRRAAAEGSSESGAAAPKRKKVVKKARSGAADAAVSGGAGGTAKKKKVVKRVAKKAASPSAGASGGETDDKPASKSGSGPAKKKRVSKKKASGGSSGSSGAGDAPAEAKPTKKVAKKVAKKTAKKRVTKKKAGNTGEA